MTNLKLDQYVETVAARLKTLPEPERKSQIDELRQHLESLVAANQTQGVSVDIATETALQQFGNAQEIGSDLGRSVWRMRLKRLPESLVIVLSVAAGLVLKTLLFRFGYGPLVQALLPDLSLPDMPQQAVIRVDPLFTFTLLAGLAACAVLFFRDGAMQTLRRLVNPATVAGAAFYWMVLEQLSHSILNRALSQALIEYELWDFESIIALGPVYAVVPPAFAAWIVTRISPRNGMAGIAAGIGVATTLGLAGFLLAQWGPVLSQPSNILVYFTRVPTMLFSVLISASLAYGLNRRRLQRTP